MLEIINDLSTLRTTYAIILMRKCTRITELRYILLYVSLSSKYLRRYILSKTASPINIKQVEYLRI